MNYAIKVLEQERVMLEKILKPYRYNIAKGFTKKTETMKFHEERLNDINNALHLIKS